jgi:uncharacterized membrane protein YbaN (DUF454 family)
VTDESSESPALDEIRGELRLSRSPAVRYLYIAAGTIAFVLGMIGLLLPVVPTSPFLLLTAFCYARGSERFYIWLITNPHFGDYIRALRKGEGIPLRIKVYAIVLLWATLGSTIVFIVPLWQVKAVLALVGMGVTVYIAQLPTKPE